MDHPADVGLDNAIIEAHECRDGDALVRLYQRAANIKKARGDDESYWFLLTHAYVFALECGHEDASDLRSVLKAVGREA